MVWELKSKDSRLGYLMKNEDQIENKYKKRQRQRSLILEFQQSKQEDREFKDRFQKHKRLCQKEQLNLTQSRRHENLSKLSASRQNFASEKNYAGSLHKRERDHMWETKRINERKFIKQNSRLVNHVKSEVGSQMYTTNTKRWEEISQQN